MPPERVWCRPCTAGAARCGCTASCSLLPAAKMLPALLLKLPPVAVLLLLPTRVPCWISFLLQGVKPRPTPATSIPGLLSLFQNVSLLCCCLPSACTAAHGAPLL